MAIAAPAVKRAEPLFEGTDWTFDLLHRLYEEIEVVAREDLRELDVGDWTGLSRDEIEAVEGARLAAFESEDPHVRPGGGETRGEIRLRVREVVERLADEHPDDDLLLVVHLGVVRALIPGAEPDHLDLYETTLEEIRRARSATSLGVPPR